MRKLFLHSFLGSLSLFCVTSAALEYYPLQIVFVRPGTPTSIVLATGTPDELANLLFTIVEPPKNGILLGFPPELVYIPAEGFIGTDWITFLVQALDGTIFDYGTVQLRVLGPLEMMAPSFRSEGSLTFSGPAFALDAYRFDFGFYGRFAYLDAQAHATWDHTGFSSFRTIARVELEGDWPSPWRLPITSTLTFNPATLSLTSWTVDARTLVLGWNIAYYFYYSGADPEVGSYATFTAQGSIDRYSLTSRLKYATLTPTFDEWTLNLSGPWPFCGCPITWELEFIQKKLGFDHLGFTIRDIPIPCPICQAFQVSLDVRVTFATEAKKVEPSLRLWSGMVCIRPLVSLLLSDDGLGISGFEVYGMEIRCDLPSGYKARFATSFNPERDSAVTGYPDFFEVIQLEGPVIPCCGSPGWWQFSFYFERASGRLFGLAMFDANMYIPISREFIAYARLQAGLIPGAPTKTWVLTLGWRALF